MLRDKILIDFRIGMFLYDNKYFRDQLKQHYNLGECYLEVDLNDLSSYDELLADKLMKSPSEYIPLVSEFYLHGFHTKLIPTAWCWRFPSLHLHIIPYLSLWSALGNDQLCIKERMHL